MGAERTPGKPTTRRYTPDEKAQAVRLVRQLRAELGVTQGTVKRIAEQLGYGVESVRQWVRQAEIDAGEQPGTTSAEAARVRQLERITDRNDECPIAGVARRAIEGVESVVIHIALPTNNSIGDSDTTAAFCSQGCRPRPAEMRCSPCRGEWWASSLSPRRTGVERR
jgi:transposase